MTSIFRKSKFLLSFVPILTAACAHHRTLAEMPAPPEYIEVVHPASLDIADIRGALRANKAPTAEELAGCLQPLLEVQSLTTGKNEVQQAAVELIHKDAPYYHYCFYSSITSITDTVRDSAILWSKKKSMLLQNFAVLVPLARAFKLEFQDTRYLRVSIRHYKQLSAWVFFRDLELTPEMTAELVDVQTNAFANRRMVEDRELSVLDRYNVRVVRFEKIKQADLAREQAGSDSTQVNSVPQAPVVVGESLQPVASDNVKPPETNEIANSSDEGSSPMVDSGQASSNVDTEHKPGDLIDPSELESALRSPASSQE